MYVDSQEQIRGCQ